MHGCGSIPHELGLKALKKALGKRRSKQISTDELVKLAKFLLQDNFLDLMEK